MKTIVSKILFPILIFLGFSAQSMTDNKFCGTVFPRQVKVSAIQNSAQGDSSKMENLKLGIVQYPVNGGVSEQTYIETVNTYVQKAKLQGAQLVVFPELAAFQMLNNKTEQEQQFTHLAKQFSLILLRMQTIATKHKISILTGSMPRLVEGKIRNTAALIFSNGKYVLQDKIFLTPDEISWGWESGTQLKVFDAPWGKSVILICHDCEFPQLSQLLVNEKPELILVPSMTESINGFRRVRWSANARAIEHRAYVVHTGTVGEIEGGWNNYAQASVITPSEPGFPGVLMEGVIGKPEIFMANLDMSLLRQKRQDPGVYPARDQWKRIQPIVVENVKTNP